MGRSRKNTKRIILIAFEWTVIIALLLLVFFGYQFYKEYSGKSVKGKGKSIELLVEQGEGTKEIAAKLKKEGLISYEYAFVLRAMDDSYRGKIQTGQFALDDGMTISEMLDEMTNVKTYSQKETTKFTIPEGYSTEMIGNKLEELGICSAADFYSAANTKGYDYPFLKDIPADDRILYPLQGFLFPDTYEIYKDATPEEIVEVMLRGFEAHFPENYITRARELGHSVYEIVTIASIIEREAKLDEERPTISGVIYNRLADDMKLQMCPTVLYVTTDGLYNVNQVLYSDLEVNSPYNTYQNNGLPLGPICSPGASSLEAALNPEEHEYLFYHTDDEAKGNHIFTKTYEEHQDTRIKK